MIDSTNDAARVKSPEDDKKPETIGEKIAGFIGVLVFLSLIGVALYYFGPGVAANFGFKQTVSDFHIRHTQETGIQAAAKVIREGSAALETYEYTYKGTTKLEDVDITIRLVFESGQRPEEMRYFEEWAPEETKIFRSDRFDYSKMKRIDLIGTAKKRGVPVLIDVSFQRSELKPVSVEKPSGAASGGLGPPLRK